MKKFTLALTVALFAAALTLSMSVTPARSQATSTPVPLPTNTPYPAVPQKPGQAKLTFWYGLGGLLGNVVQATVNKFNESQEKYYVEAVFQASYDDTINKINAGLASGQLPNIAQIFEAGTQRMIDTKKIIPVQDLIDRDKLADLVADLEPAVRANYTVNGKLVSMPFNSSTAMMYFDRAAMKAAGLDPDKKIWTYEEVLDAARKLTVKDANGKVTRTGLALYGESWFVEQTAAIHEQYTGDPANGHQARVTKYTFNNDAIVKYFDFLKKGLDEKTATWYGPAGSGDASAAFVKGEAAIAFSSIASLRTLLDSVQKAGSKVDVGVAFFPRQAGAKGRTIVGGASLWVTNVGTQSEQDGAWEFVKFAARPDIQAFWSSNTGYYPIRQAAYVDPLMVDALKKYPQFQVAIDSIRSGPVSDYNSALVSGTFVSMRQDIIKALDNYFTGKSKTAQEALDAAVKAANEKLEEYNSTVK